MRRLNRELKRTSRDLTACICALEARGRDYDVSDIVTRDDIARNKLTLLQYMDLQIAGKHASKRFGTEAALRHTRASVAGFTGSRAVGIPEIDSRFVSDYEAFLHGRGVSHNTVCYYMRNLKAIYRQAKADGYRICAADPFEHVRSKPRKTVKRALKREEIRRLYHADLTQYPPPRIRTGYLYVQLFLPGHAVRRRHLPAEAQPLRRRPRLRTAQDRPVVAGGADPSAANPDRQIRLPVVPVRIRFPVRRGRVAAPLSVPHGAGAREPQSEAAGPPLLHRHAADDICCTPHGLRSPGIGYSASVISEGLGHTTEKTTRIYLKEFDRGVVDRANELVSEL